MITRNFNLFLNAGKHFPLVINVNQYDHDEQWCFTLLNDNGEKYIPSTGAIVGIKADRLGIINSGTVNASGQVVINETQQMTAAAGKAVFELLIDDQTHGTANFVVLVEPKPGDNADLSESDLSLIEQAIEAASAIKPYGSPLVASTVAGMTDHEKVYVYVGSETGYTSGNWYYWDGTAWTSGGVYNSVAVQTDTTLTLSGVAADSKKVGDEINDLKSQLNTIDAIPREVRLAMDTLFSKMGVKDDDGYTSQYGVFHAWASAINLVSISAVFTQGENLIFSTDSLDVLRQYLVVTATYDDDTSAPVSNYTLSGTLTAGTSTITVTCENKTATFTVDVTQAEYLTVDLSTFVPGRADKTNVIYNSAGNSLTVSSKVAWQYVQAKSASAIPLAQGYSYRLTFHMDYVSGSCRGGFEDTGGAVKVSTGAQTTSGDYSVITSLSTHTYTNDEALIMFGVTWSTTENGNATFSNVKLLKYLTPTESE